MAFQESGKFDGLQGNSSDFLKVLLKLEQRTMKDLHVATIGQVVSHDGQKATVKPLPFTNEESEKVINCHYLQSLTLNDGDVVVVLYMDRDFIQALKQLKIGQKCSAINKSSELHSEKYGIIIGILFSGSQNDNND